ncbi:HAD family hydrolase [Gulosibacter macacae]|uniref:HAD family hydrolase n=1 Tax=Gulosibacter macacae TaxID=2488791 RepID=A0A3P3VU20_9MICO|nr:HAD family hydrolase [Gulosibacter macacae]RRJ86311.1 HAD family hydrolase [Gulosibacter macacae]
MSTPISAVVFDLDGTLHDHDASATAGFGEWIGALGSATTAELAAEWLRIEHEWFGRWERGEIDFAAQRRGRVREFLPLIGGLPGDDWQLDAQFAEYVAAYERHWQPFPDVAPFLEAFAELHLPVAVLSNGIRPIQRAKLDAIGVGDRLGRLITADDVGAPKPSPRMYEAACAAVGFAPERVLHVGDRPDIDVAAARAFGMQAVLVDREGQHGDADALRSLMELLPTLADRVGA